jgi:uncharacterized membrane protein YedE/YeeE
MFGIVAVISFNSLALGYFLYSLFAANSQVPYLAYILFMTIVTIKTNLLYRLEWSSRLASTAMVLASLGIGLLVLRQLLTQRL